MKREISKSRCILSALGVRRFKLHTGGTVLGRSRWSGWFARGLLLLAPVFAAYGARQAVSLAAGGGSAVIPNSSAFNSLGSYWFDYRVTAWTLPSSGCQQVIQLPGPGANTLQVRICAPSVGWQPFIIFGSDSTQGGVPLSVGPPHIAITSVSNSSPAVLTLASGAFSTMSVGATITVASAGGAGCGGLNGNHAIAGVDGNSVTIDYDGAGCAYAANSAAAYSQDFVFRYHRDLALRQLIGESWNVDGTGYSEYAVNMLSSDPATLPGTLSFGPANVSLAFFRWYAGTIPVGVKPPWGVSANAGSTVLADWEFEGNSSDDSGNRLKLAFPSAQSFSTAPTYLPACSAGDQRTFTVGTEAQLDASRSFPLDGSETLEYSWQQIPSSEPGAPHPGLRWSSRTTVNPTISGFAPGPIDLRLVVRDQSGQTSPCTVHSGAVAVDDAGNVAIANPKIASILGPLTRWGNNTRWPWFDTVERQWADLLGGAQGVIQTGKQVSVFGDNWNVPQPGTLTATYGSVRVTGVNTTFRSTFCHGGSFTAFPQENMIILWYPQAAFIGGSGRRLEPVGKCVSDTVLDVGWQYSDDDGSSASAYNLDAPPGFAYTAGATLLWRPKQSCAGGATTLNVSGLGPVALKEGDGVTDPKPPECVANSNPNIAINLTYNGRVFTIQGTFTPQTSYSSVWIALPGTTSGMQYSLWTQADLGSWVGIATNINYYDNVLAFYTMYFRSGIDTYLHYARWLADRWWTMPYHDQGNAMGGQQGAALLPRNEAMTGLFLRAIDQDSINGVAGSSLMWPGLREEIDTGYRYALNVQSANNKLTGDLRETAYNAMYVALCAAYDPDLVHAAACRSDLNTSILTTWKQQRQPDGSWQAFAGSYSSISSTFAGMNTVNGTVTVAPGSNIVTIQGGTWSPSWFPAEFQSMANPMDYTTRDSNYYNATYVDGTHIQLDRVYGDTCGSVCSGRQWVIATGAPGTQWIGFGTQPFMLGITGQFFNQSYLALSQDTQYAATAALVKSYVVDVANWLTTTGTYAPARGLWYGVGFGVCTGTNPAMLACYSNSSPSDINGSRELSPEVLGALAMGYSYAPSAGLQAAIDNLFSAVYAKYPTDPGYDGTYAQDMDPLNSGFFWGTMNPKWLGFFWGMGRNAAWLGARQSGPAAVQ